MIEWNDYSSSDSDQKSSFIFILGYLIHLIYSYSVHQKTRTASICFLSSNQIQYLRLIITVVVVKIYSSSDEKNRKPTIFSSMRNLSKLISSISVNDSSSIFSATNSCHFSVMLVVARLIELIISAKIKLQTKVFQWTH